MKRQGANYWMVGGARRERFGDEAGGQIDGAEKARSIRRQGFFAALMLSMKITPGSGVSNVGRIILSQRPRARIDLWTVPSMRKFQKSSRGTAVIKTSVTRTERLDMRSLVGSCLAPMKASISGWSHLNAPIIAPRLDLALMMVRHIASQTSMKLSGPGASDPTPRTGAPSGRNVEK